MRRSKSPSVYFRFPGIASRLESLLSEMLELLIAFSLCERHRPWLNALPRIVLYPKRMCAPSPCAAVELDPLVPATSPGLLCQLVLLAHHPSCLIGPPLLRAVAAATFRGSQGNYCDLRSIEKVVRSTPVHNVTDSWIGNRAASSRKRTSSWEITAWTEVIDGHSQGHLR